jgi:transposase
MGYITGEDRGQEQLLPPRIEEYVSANAPVRFLDAFVEQLDLAKLGFERAVAAETGRPGYRPADLLKLFAYGYLQRIRSSRRLEAEAGRNLEVIWLLQGLRPDFKTIADFRKDNRAAFKGVLRELNLLCRKLDLFGAELVAIDGAKFKAVNSEKRHYTDKKLKDLLKRIDEKIEEYVRQMDLEDQAGEDLRASPDAASLQAKIETLKTRRGRYQFFREELAGNQATEISLTDPDSRGQRKVGIGYNVQVAVDAKHDLIVEEQVVQDANDLAQLHPMAQAAQAALAVEALKVVADAGYHAAGQLEACEAAKLTTYVSAPGTCSGKTRDGEKVYPKEAFPYDTAHDCYHCPAGQTLVRTGEGLKNEKPYRYYQNLAACGQCKLRAECTTGKYRKIARLENAAVVGRQAARVHAQPGIVRERKTIVEHVFGSLRNWGHDTFLCRGLAMVRAEFSLSALTYNLRRALNLVGVTALLAALNARA